MGFKLKTAFEIKADTKTLNTEITAIINAETERFQETLRDVIDTYIQSSFIPTEAEKKLLVERYVADSMAILKQAPHR